MDFGGNVTVVVFGYTLLVFSKILVLIFGSNICLLAYRSYRKYNQRLMLEICLGFAFITIGNMIEGFMYEILSIAIDIDHIVESAFVLIGMVIIGNTMLFGRETDD